MIPVRDMRSVLYATAILFALAVLVLRGAFLWIEYRTALARAEAATQDLALLMEEYTKRTLETSDLLLSEVVAYVQSKGGVGALSEAQGFLVDVMHRSSAGHIIILVDRQGQLVASSVAQVSGAMSFADRTWFKVHRAGAETYVGGAIVGRLSHELLYTYSKQISDTNGEFDGVAHIGLRPSFLQDLSRPDADTEHVTLGIWGRDGRVIARTGLTQEQIDSGVGHTALFNEKESQLAGTYREKDPVDGITRIISFRRLERWPVTVTASIPMSAALASWTKGLYWSAVISAIILAAFAWLTWLGIRLSRQTEQTQQQLRTVNDELAQALEDKVTLLQEIHHRVKNNLAITSSLLQMQARRFSDQNVKTAFQETQDRLQSVGLIHDLLYRKETGGTINLQDYLSRLVEELSSTYGADERGIALELDAEPISIDLERAAPLALAVTEAITNAFKHAFMPEQHGRIQVLARRIGDQIEVSVSDNGGGVGDGTENESSLGMRLIRAFAAQLDGTFTLESNSGTTCRLVFPA
ncbi:sensor histidine kinase [Microvirga guangxiensis]|uniref:histidine kinase n=1 Tax=Microvirga guangxiensis TaxID=549386 RepID=A0A1G5L925_9HYPH|nr:histidine kinase dimerization/phosphoacceptor domain -containing protein [Microvirga guangxiensis]SCZ09453.1 Two-component sensor histidine kinase, contains HisKA and HATPase domains [Microvirga guangxiensis]